MKVCNYIYEIVRQTQKTNVDAIIIKNYLELSQNSEMQKREIIELGSDPNSQYGTRMNKKEKEEWAKWVLNL